MSRIYSRWMQMEHETQLVWSILSIFFVNAFGKWIDWGILYGIYILLAAAILVLLILLAMRSHRSEIGQLMTWTDWAGAVECPGQGQRHATTCHDPTWLLAALQHDVRRCQTSQMPRVQKYTKWSWRRSMKQLLCRCAVSAKKNVIWRIHSRDARVIVIIEINRILWLELVIRRCYTRGLVVSPSKC